MTEFNLINFIEDSMDFAKAMTLDSNKKVLPKMLEKNTENWNVIVDTLNKKTDISSLPSETVTKYLNKRVTELSFMDKESLANYIAELEVELMDVSDSVLDDDYPDMAVQGIQSNLDKMDNSALKLMKELDEEDEETGLKRFHALWKYRAV